VLTLFQEEEITPPPTPPQGGVIYYVALPAIFLSRKDFFMSYLKSRKTHLPTPTPSKPANRQAEAGRRGGVIVI